jgi:chromate transporter
VATLWQIFATFAKIGAFTIGGGYAMIPLIKDELVKRGWLSEEELPDIIALAQSAPGVLAVNMSIFAGHRLRGVKGSIAATLGSVLPAFLTILLIAMLFKGYQDNPVVIRIFKGIRPVVVSLIAVPMINMARKSNKTWWAWVITTVTLVLVAFLKVSPIYILLVIIVLATAFTIYKEKKWKTYSNRHSSDRIKQNTDCCARSPRASSV